VTRRNCGRILATAVFAPHSFAQDELQARKVKNISDIYAPVIVGCPPCDGGTALVRLENGEIRHYNYNEHRLGRPPLYLSSLDDGLTWVERQLPSDFIGADRRSPISGEYIRVFEYWRTVGASDSSPIEQGDRRGTFVVRSRGGIDGTWTVRRIFPDPIHMQRPPVFIRRGRRILAPCQTTAKFDDLPPRDGAGTLYSDDDGLSWKLSNFVTAPPHVPGGIDRGPRWQKGACNPTVVELRDGRVWMLARTSQDVLYESFSRDGGEVWEAPRPSRFYSTLTMPNMGRLKDGRILLLWNNTTSLPEVERNETTRFYIGTQANNGQSEDVFTNRDAFHGAISEDDGHTWLGFREVVLDRRRNAEDYAESGGVDHSVHQNQFVELPGGKVLVSVGQHELHRVMVVFDLAWLYEKKRENRFENGLEDWSVQKYVAGIRGHCSFNRRQGCALIEHPERAGSKVLHIRRPKDPLLVTENDGAVWNFPASKAGSLKLRIRFQQGGQGGRISLLDRWVNPTDFASVHYAMFNLRIGGDGQSTNGLRLRPGTWHELEFQWDGGADCRMRLDGMPSGASLPLNRTTVDGISYLHLMSTAETEDKAGFLIESVAAAS